MRHSKCVVRLVAALVAGFPLAAYAQSYKVLYSFIEGGSNGDTPYNSLLYQGGQLYGTTEFGGKSQRGVVFALNLTTMSETVAANLSSNGTGTLAEGGLAYFQGALYGTSFGSKSLPGGAIYKVNIASGHATTLDEFGSGFVEPNGLTRVGSIAYGTTKFGGLYNAGSLFSVDLRTHILTTLHSFGATANDGQPGEVLTYVSGVLYGVQAHNTVFGYNIATGAVAPVAVVNDPLYTGVIYYGGYLYGTAMGSSNTDNGEVYRVDLKSGQVSVLYTFQGGADGKYPEGLLVYNAGTLYGTTDFGGTANAGTVFALDLKSRSKRILHSFQGGADGDYPASNMVWGAGTLYGTVDQGGTGNAGIIFALTP